MSKVWIILLIVAVTRDGIYMENNCGCSISRNSIKENGIHSFKDIVLKNIRQCPIVNINNVKDFKVTDAMVLLPSGEYQLGTDEVIMENDNEGPMRMITLKSFYFDKYEVSNKDFEVFVNSTDYKTDAEIFGDSFVFTLFLNETFKEELKDFRVLQAPWWYKTISADWRHPYGPDSNILDIMDHPVVHVSWRDAEAYCRWRDARLPTEAEWEAACRGGVKNTKYPWGDKLFPNRKYMANIWQGTFPNYNTMKDGFVGTNPVNLFPQNNFDIHNIAGNVWEWTQSSWTEDDTKEKVKKGGSYLCHRSYCYRYRCSARSHNTEDSSAGNLGFRCAKAT